MSDTEFLAYGSRVKEIRKRLQLSQKEFSEGLEISYGYMSEIEAGKRAAGYKFLKNLYMKYRVNFKFLFTGKGPMLETDEDEKGVRMDFGEDGEIIRDMLQLIQKSPLVRFTVLQNYRTYKFNNKGLIKQDIAETAAKSKKKK